MSNNFEVKYTIRLYEPALIAELAGFFEKFKERYKNKNEFFTHIIELGLKASRQEAKKTANNKPAIEPEYDEMYSVFMDFYKYASKQFRKIYLDLNVQQRLLCAIYNVALALNNDERLFGEKIEDGFYDDMPVRFGKIIEDLIKAYGLS